MILMCPINIPLCLYHHYPHGTLKQISLVSPLSPSPPQSIRTESKNFVENLRRLSLLLLPREVTMSSYRFRKVSGRGIMFTMLSIIKGK